MRIKVIGAGSIGNHLSQASRRMGWDVVLCDVNPAALERTRNSIYPTRYGSWDDAIQLVTCSQAPVGGFEIIVIGTPPDSHLDLGFAALKEKPRAILVEKPLCGPLELDRAQQLADEAEQAGVMLFIGYDHVVGAAADKVRSVIGDPANLGSVISLDVEFREHWRGIFAAHPWLAGPQDTYLGNWRKGGAASGEHSHGINLWQHFAQAIGTGPIVEVSAMLDFVRGADVDYDRLAFMSFKCEGGLIGRVIQDVVTYPPRKWSRIQGDAGFVEWHCGFESGCDAVRGQRIDGEPWLERFVKTRPDDFFLEMQHIGQTMAGGTAAAQASPLAYGRGLDTLLILAAVHMSAEHKRSVFIDKSKGCRQAALSLG
jgi:predicted dehydrogenase